jgi:hypothetical protein
MLVNLIICAKMLLLSVLFAFLFIVFTCHGNS